MKAHVGAAAEDTAGVATVAKSSVIVVTGREEVAVVVVAGAPEAQTEEKEQGWEEVLDGAGSKWLMTPEGSTSTNTTPPLLPATADATLHL